MARLCASPIMAVTWACSEISARWPNLCTQPAPWSRPFPPHPPQGLQPCPSLPHLAPRRQPLRLRPVPVRLRSLRGHLLSKNTFHLVSLGCAKNTVDSDSMAELLQRDGYRPVERPQRASVLIVNT